MLVKWLPGPKKNATRPSEGYHRVVLTCLSQQLTTITFLQCKYGFRLSLEYNMEKQVCGKRPEADNTHRHSRLHYTYTCTMEQKNTSIAHIHTTEVQ